MSRSARRLDPRSQRPRLAHRLGLLNQSGKARPHYDGAGPFDLLQRPLRPATPNKRLKLRHAGEVVVLPIRRPAIAEHSRAQNVVVKA